MSIRTCSECFHWTDGTCRAHPPAPAADGSPIWVRTAPTDWCNKFKARIQAVGYDRKFTDEQLLEEVLVYDRPMEDDEGNPIPKQAVRRSDLIWTMQERFSMSGTPILRRIEKLVRRGILKQGPNPWPREGMDNDHGIFVWMGSAVLEKPAEKKSRLGELMTILTAIAPDDGKAKSVREVTKAAEKTLGLSSTSIHRKLTALVTEGKVARNDDGYFVAPFQPGVEV